MKSWNNRLLGFCGVVVFLSMVFGCSGLFQDLDDLEMQGDDDAGHLDSGDTGGDAEDGDADDVALNSCGGTQVLDNEPGTSCGPCDDGEWICEGTDDVVCVAATEVNACGGCGGLPAIPGETCIPDGGIAPDDEESCTEDSDCGGSYVCVDEACVFEYYSGVWQCDEDHQLNCVSRHATCEDPDPPTRCFAYPDSFAWQPASIVTILTLASDECCRDINGDGENDNAVVSLIEAMQGASVEDFNTHWATSIANGELILVLEHDGIDDPVDSNQYVLNVLEGSSATTTGVAIDTGSFEQGSHPRWFFPEAQVSDGELAAQLGTMNLQYNFIAPMETPVHSVVLTGNLSAPGIIEDGLAITGGLLSGVILLEDFTGSLNEVAKNCACLDNPDSLLLFDPTDSSGECAMEDVDPIYDDCWDAGEDHCAALLQICSQVGFLPMIADIDTNGSGYNDAMSIGMTIKADPILIDGVE